ncbi:MAG: hypothetical protein JRJ29_06155, partial [Deltaproteobacteria bacterium]|nr:hypothetical protein [Deltaproteobacteria bacterium]
MGEIFVLVEHRNGEIREISYQMLWKADQLCRDLGHGLVAIIIGTQEDSTLREISERVDRVVSVGGEELKHFNAD